MDEDIIDDIAETLANQVAKARSCGDSITAEIACLAVYDDIEAMALVVNQHQPTYDLRYFYRRTTYPEPFPVHPII